MISKLDQNRIAEAVDIVDLVGAEVQLKPQGKRLVGCCPFHNEKTGSFTVSQSRQTYHCFGCGKHGDVFSWVLEREGCSFPEAIRRLAKRANIEEAEEHSPADVMPLMIVGGKCETAPYIGKLPMFGLNV